MTELEREIFMRLLIDLFLERPGIEKRMAEKQRSMDAKTDTQTAHHRSIVVTPEIEDGYNGIVKRLVCSSCQRVFYLTDTDYQSLHPTLCHECSVKRVEGERIRTRSILPY